jgi:hypothetical protein
MLQFLPRKVFRSALAEGDFALRSLNQQVYKIFPFLAFLPRKVFRSALAEGDFALRSLNQHRL